MWRPVPSRSLRLGTLLAVLAGCGERPGLPPPAGDRVGAAVAVYRRLQAEAAARLDGPRIWFLEFEGGDPEPAVLMKLEAEGLDVRPVSAWPHPPDALDFQGDARLNLQSLDSVGRATWSGECSWSAGGLEAGGLEIGVEWGGAGWEAVSATVTWTS